MKLVFAFLVLVTTVAGCDFGRTGGGILDGLSVGVPASCGTCTEPQSGGNCGKCESVATLARRGFDEEWPGHPGIVSISFHQEGGYPRSNGEEILHTRSGSLLVAVATFTDGTQHAVGVYCGVGGCIAPAR
jgi:hypothetical protein